MKQFVSVVMCIVFDMCMIWFVWNIKLKDGNSMAINSINKKLFYLEYLCLMYHGRLNMVKDNCCHLNNNAIGKELHMKYPGSNSLNKAM